MSTKTKHTYMASKNKNTRGMKFTQYEGYMYQKNLTHENHTKCTPALNVIINCAGVMKVGDLESMRPVDHVE